MWPEYVPVAERRARAMRLASKRRKSGSPLVPVAIEGRKITKSFWGNAWCENLQAYSDFASRLPRGATYVRNGSVIHLQIAEGKVEAMVSGSEIYDVRVTISPLQEPRWKKLVAKCSGHVGSLVELLQGRLSNGVMQLLVQREHGLFPAPKEIEFSCSCPDVASMCKHVAAVLYGVGARFDTSPELFFALRQVDGAELVAAASGASGLAAPAAPAEERLAGVDLGTVFGIEIDAAQLAEPAEQRAKAAEPPAASPRRRQRAPRRAAAERVEDDGFGEVLGPGLEISGNLLLAYGVPRATYARWVANGVLERTKVRAVYRTTARTLPEFRELVARPKAK